MAGEIEEPLRMSYQVDTLHSGSISFGRFESESLSWERRSMFSHNKYLEEVEKYSKPGSVIEKKAYFEAHFRKKALMRQASSECQNMLDYQRVDNDVLANMGCQEERDRVNDNSHCPHFEESPNSSVCHEEFESEEPEITNSELQTEVNIGSTHDKVINVLQQVEPNETDQTESQCADLLVDEKPEVELKQDRDVEAPNKDEFCNAIGSTTKAGAVEEGVSTSLESHESPPPNLRDAENSLEVTMSRLKYQIGRNISNHATKDSSKGVSRRERNSLMRMKPEKLSSQDAVPTTRSIHKSASPEDPENSKDCKVKKVVLPQPSALEKVVLSTPQTIDRCKRTPVSNKTVAKPTFVGLNFKCDERAERRKEFYMKLEEKMHAKEAELDKVHARTQVL